MVFFGWKNFSPLKQQRLKRKKNRKIKGRRSYEGRVESYGRKDGTYDRGTGGKVFERVEKMESFMSRINELGNNIREFPLFERNFNLGMLEVKEKRKTGRYHR